MNQYLYVGLAVLADTAGASALKAADGFRIPVPSMLAILAYGGAFVFLALAVRTIPIGIANALWSGLSIVLVALVGYLVHGQTLNKAAVLGMLLVFAGTVVLNLGFADARN
jgi:multidrug transporter EmrE-like cation transporter